MEASPNKHNHRENLRNSLRRKTARPFHIKIMLGTLTNHWRCLRRSSRLQESLRNQGLIYCHRCFHHDWRTLLAIDHHLRKTRKIPSMRKTRVWILRVQRMWQAQEHLQEDLRTKYKHRTPLHRTIAKKNSVYCISKKANEANTQHISRHDRSNVTNL